jgi:hypothetical protein
MACQLSIKSVPLGNAPKRIMHQYLGPVILTGLALAREGEKSRPEGNRALTLLTLPDEYWIRSISHAGASGGCWRHLIPQPTSACEAT